MRLFFTALFLIGFAAAPVAGQWESMEVGRYRTGSDDLRLGYVIGYVDGVLAANLGPAADASEFGQCLGEAMAGGTAPALRLRDVFDSYIDEQPPEEEDYALESFLYALFEACGRPLRD